MSYERGGGLKEIDFYREDTVVERWGYANSLHLKYFMWTLGSYSILVIGYCPTFK